MAKVKMSLIKKPLLSGVFKKMADDKKIELACYYAGCGGGDSWPAVLN